LIEGQGGKAFPITGDVRHSPDCESAVEAAVMRFGGLDIVFCNAGVFEGGTAESQTEASWDLQVDTMLKGTFLTCKHAIPALRKRGGGSIILSGSNCSHIGCSGRFAYTAAKSAMPILARQLSNDYYHTAKIRTNCVSPGYVRTPMTEKIWREQTRTPVEVPFPESLANTWQKPEAISSAVLFLASEEASDITGVTIPVSRTALWRVAAQK
jgi:NAD(P)-dependent dehydrogenase (short-subunit alcohol dehydrogenase family)